jgi:hypothetical protein
MIRRFLQFQIKANEAATKVEIIGITAKPINQTCLMGCGIEVVCLKICRKHWTSWCSVKLVLAHWFWGHYLPWLFVF